MSLTELNGTLVQIITKKKELTGLAYDNTRYDDVEEELHDLEDEFNESYGDFLEEILETAHRKLRSDTDVLLPTAYLPNALLTEEIGSKEGVWIDSEEYAGKKAHLVLVPNPPRLLVTVGKERREVWKLDLHPAH